MTQQLTSYELFDDEDAYASDAHELNDGLLPHEIEDAARIAAISRGVMLVTGMPGAGKDLFSNILSYKIKKYFTGRHVVRDERPRSLFGIYTPFNEDMLLEDAKRMEQVAKGEGAHKQMEDKTTGTADQLIRQRGRWNTKGGEVLLQNSVQYYSEFWRYLHNRRPFNPMGIMLGGVLKIWRHLDTLIIGVCQQLHELDKYSCQPYATYEVRCSWSSTRQYTGRYQLRKVRYISSTGVFEMGSSKPTTIWLDGNKPRPVLGMWINHLPNGTRISQLGQDIVEVVHDNPKIDLYNLSVALNRDSEEVEDALNRLIQREIVSCYRYFDLYNSKSAVALKPKVSFKM